MLVSLLLLTIASVALSAYAATDRLLPVDRAIADALQSTPAGAWIEHPADWLALNPLEAIVLFGAATVAMRTRSLLLAAAVVPIAFALALNTPLKELIERPRPAASDVIVRDDFPGYGFPSGHAMSAAIVYGYAIALALLTQPRRIAAPVAALGVACIALVGWDRVWDGAHWPSDVLGGWLIGAWFVTAIVLLVRALGAPSGAQAQEGAD